jgi:tRNA uridine 5-carboxymethylaminomethyl modification enzyme
MMSSRTATPNALAAKNISVNADGVHRSAFELLGYQTIGWEDLYRVWPELQEISPAIAEQMNCDALYAGYMSRTDADIAAFRKDEALLLPEDLEYEGIGSLSNEISQKLKQARPATLGAASRIPGVTPAALVALLRHVRKKKRAAAPDQDAA